MNRVACYGTLKKNHHNHYLLGDSKFIAKAKVRGTMYSLGGFPAITLHGNTDIHCELYDCDDETLKQLDRLEGAPDWYQRDKVETSEGPAWIYTMNKLEGSDAAPIVKSGEWI